MESHLLQMRGLKPNFMEYSVPYIQSHLLQMRGLKLTTFMSKQRISFVASFTDAWIETFDVESFWEIYKVASFTDAWIETPFLPLFVKICSVASFTDAWIETLLRI